MHTCGYFHFDCCLTSLLDGMFFCHRVFFCVYQIHHIHRLSHAAPYIPLRRDHYNRPHILNTKTNRFKINSSSIEVIALFQTLFNSPVLSSTSEIFGALHTLQFFRRCQFTLLHLPHTQSSALKTNPKLKCSYRLQSLAFTSFA